MKKSPASLLFAVLVSIFLSACASLGGGGGEPAIVLADSFTVESEVVAIDQATRRFTLRNADGQLTSGVAGPEIKNLAQVRVGDRVQAQYSQALTLNLKRKGGPSYNEVTTGSARAAQGERPAAASAREVHFVADITKIDPATGRMTVRGAAGRLFDLQLKNPAVLQGYVPGDQVEGTFLQVLAIGVLPAAGKK